MALTFEGGRERRAGTELGVASEACLPDDEEVPVLAELVLGVCRLADLDDPADHVEAVGGQAAGDEHVEAMGSLPDPPRHVRDGRRRPVLGRGEVANQEPLDETHTAHTC